ncbi:MAG TPA: hypothetical protein VIP48_11595, partial [Streptosporangiaceae bacterium]
QVGFNYLGRFSTSPGTQPASPGTQPAPPGRQPAPPGAQPAQHGRRYWTSGSLGGDVDPATPVKHALEASAITRDTPDGMMLRLSLSWPDGLLQESAARELAGEWAAMLTGLVSHAAHPAAGGHTPSDFPLVALGQDQIEKLEAGLAADLARDLAADPARDLAADPARGMATDSARDMAEREGR